jgi:hypothetical protein
MSVTRPTFMPLPLPLDELLAAVLVLLDAAAPPLPLVLVAAALELLLLLLLPHAASPRASAAVARATRPTGLILPVTRSPFRQKLNGQP